MGSSSNRSAPPLPQQETKSSTKQLAPTDPILSPENLLKTGFPENLLKTDFAQKGLPSYPFWSPLATKLHWDQNTAFLQPWYKKFQKKNLNTVPKMGPAWRSHFWDHIQSLVKEQRKTLSRSHFWDRLAVQKMRPQSRKINSKGRPVQQTKKITTAFIKRQTYKFGTRRARTYEACFNWLSGPRNGTWERTCGISCLRSLAPIRRLRYNTTQATFTNPSLLRATPLLRAMFQFHYPI